MNRFESWLRAIAQEHARTSRDRLVETRHVLAALVGSDEIRAASGAVLPTAQEVLGDARGVVIRYHHEVAPEADAVLARCTTPEAAAVEAHLLLGLAPPGSGPATQPSPSGLERVTVTLRNSGQPVELRVVPDETQPYVTLGWLGHVDDDVRLRLVFDDSVDFFDPYSSECQHTVNGAEPFNLVIDVDNRVAVVTVTYVPRVGERLRLQREGLEVEVEPLTGSAEEPVDELDDSSTLGGLSPPRTASPEQRRAFREGVEQLSQLVGLDDVKQRVSELVDHAVVMGFRRSHDLEVPSTSRHLVFTGAPGTGKTEVARIFAKLLYGLGLLDRPITVEASRNDLVGHYAGHTAQKTTEVVTSALGGVLFIDEAYTLVRDVGDISAAYGAEAIDTLLKLMEDRRERLTVIVAGYPDLMERLLDANPGLRSRFTQQVRFDDYSDETLAEIFVQMAERFDYRTDDSVRRAVETHFNGVERTESFGNARAVRNLFEAAVSNQAARIASSSEPTADELMELRVDDVFPSKIEPTTHDSNSGLAAAMDSLDAMVGLEPVKAEVHRMVSVVEVNTARRRLGLSAPTVARHLVFTGPPGTGKTTVAGHLAQALRSLGVVDRGHLVAVTKADLVAEWLGQTPVKTRAAVQRALDGVLFIDEAYSLTGDERDSYGREAVEMLLKLMEDFRDRLVVIIAGYPDEMNHFLDSNPGLRSRFTKRIEFPSYSHDELIEIFARLARSQGYDLAPGTIEMVGERIAGIADVVAFGNGRGIRNLFQEAAMRLAMRVDAATATREELSLLLPEDIPEPEAPQRRKVGFS